MARDDALKLLSSEFKLWGVDFQHSPRGNGHIELRWKASPDKQVRSYIIAKTPSDHRGWLNARAEIRRLFRADGLSLKEEKKVSALQKALSLPKPVETHEDQLKALRAEVADLTELVLELGIVIAKLNEPQPAAPAPIVVEKKPSVQSVKAIEYLGDGWNSTEALARDMGLPVEVVYRKLWYLKSKGKAELSQGKWRKRQQPKPIFHLSAAAG